MRLRSPIPPRPEGASFEELRAAHLAKRFDLRFEDVFKAVKAWNRLDDRTKKSYSIYVRS